MLGTWRAVCTLFKLSRITPALFRFYTPVLYNCNAPTSLNYKTTALHFPLIFSTANLKVQFHVQAVTGQFRMSWYMAGGWDLGVLGIWHLVSWLENHIILEHNVMWLFASRALRFRALRFSSQDKRLNIQGVQERYKTGIAIFRTQPSPVHYQHMYLVHTNVLKPSLKFKRAHNDKPVHCCPKGQIWQIGRLPNPKLTQKSKFNFFFKCYHNICHQTVIKLDWSNTKSKNNVFVFFCSNLWFDFTPLERKSTFLVAL